MFGFDVEQVDANLELKGDLPAIIHTIKKTTTKESGKMMIVAEFKIVGEKFNGVIFKNNYVIDGPSAMGTKLFFNLTDIVGVERTALNSESGLSLFIGKQVIIKVGKKKTTDQYSQILTVTKSETKETESEF